MPTSPSKGSGLLDLSQNQTLFHLRQAAGHHNPRIDVGLGGPQKIFRKALPRPVVAAKPFPVTSRTSKPGLRAQAALGGLRPVTLGGLMSGTEGGLNPN
jgi:hypothetical protein